jgi:hypothetical protein
MLKYYTNYYYNNEQKGLLIKLSLTSFTLFNTMLRYWFRVLDYTHLGFKFKVYRLGVWMLEFRILEFEI